MNMSAFQVVARNHTSTRRPVNLSLTADLVDAAKLLGINVSQTCDSGLREEVRKKQEELWKAEYAEFIAEYNATVEKEGLPLERLRTF